MSVELCRAVHKAGPDRTARFRQVLGLSADLADVKRERVGPLYRAMIDDLESPTFRLSERLMAATRSVSGEMVGQTVRDLLKIATEDPANPLPAALARELTTAAVWGL